MCPQIACLKGCIITQVAFVCLFSTVHFQMCLQSACITGFKITQVAFVCLFSTVHFQMCLQSTCIRGCKITLVAFVELFSTVRFQMCPQMACMRRCKVTLVAFIWFQDLYICILQTKVIIVHLFFHCQCVLCCAQMIASNWSKYIIDFWSPISLVNFHFLDALQTISISVLERKLSVVIIAN